MKYVLKGIAVLLLVCMVALVLVFSLVNPNQFKPTIKSIAKSHSLDIAIDGDLSWHFWPYLSVGVKNLSVATLGSNESPIGKFEKISLVLAIKPLLFGKLRVKKIVVRRANMTLVVDEQGKKNWEELTAVGNKKNKIGKTNKEKSNKPLDFLIEEIQLTGARLQYRDLSTSRELLFYDINANLLDVNISGRPIIAELNFLSDSMTRDKDSLARVNIRNRLSVSDNFDRIVLDGGELVVQLLAPNSAEIKTKYYATLTKSKLKEFSYLMAFDVMEFNGQRALKAVSEVPNMANLDALKKISFKGELKGDSDNLYLEPLTLMVDSTVLNASAVVSELTAPKVTIDLTGNAINLDDYLPPQSNAVATKRAEEGDALLPLEMLRDLTVDLSLNMNSATVKKIALNNLELKVGINDGLIKQRFQASAYGGVLQLKSSSDVTGSAADVSFEGSVNGVDISSLLSDVDSNKKINFAGNVDTIFQGVSSGVNVNSLINNLDASANFSGEKVRVSPLNIEKLFCKAVGFLTQHPEEKKWADYSELEKFEGGIIWRDQIIALEKFTAGLSQLLLKSTGRINLENEQYDFRLPVTFGSLSELESFDGCRLPSPGYWLNRGLSLMRCKGSVSNIQPLKDCGFDSDGLKRLAKDFAKFKLQEKHGDKIDAVEKKLADKKVEIEEKKNDAKLEAQKKINQEKERIKEKLEAKKNKLLDKLLKN